MPINRYTPEEVIKLLHLVEIETERDKTTAQTFKSPGFTEQSHYR